MKKTRLKQKAVSAITAMAMIFAIMPSFAFAEAEIAIGTADELIALAYSSNNADFAKSYRLQNDIDMSEASDTRPMKAIGSYSGGSNDIAFTGSFNGDGHKLVNLSSTGEALFGYVGESGEVKNLILDNAAVHYSQNDSSKYPAALVSLNRGTVTDCMTVNSTVVSDHCSPAGGLIGTNFGNVSRCGVYGGSVTLAISNFGTSHGGFVGNQRGGAIEECFSTADVSAKKWAGGFAGKIEAGIISDCYSLGSVTGTDDVGGFAGAFMDDAVLRNIYTAGNITAQTGGGIAGGKGFSFAVQGIPENCYYSADADAPTNSGSFVNDAAWSKLSDEMRTADFASALSDKWTQNDNINGGYPYLINAAPPVEDEIPRFITTEILIVDYDKDSQNFYKTGESFEVTIEAETATVKDIMDAASANGSLTYELGKNAQSGQIITINNITPQSPDGWLFTINGELAWVGASAATIADGDKLMWFVGTPLNGYNPPEWDNVGNFDDNYINISTADEFTEFSNNPDKWNGNYRLTANIDVSGIEISPIGNTEIPFSGMFDGNGFTISNLKITQDSNSRNVGMFGVISSAKLKNITLDNISVTGGSVVGGLTGIAKNASKITGCRVSGKITATGTSYIKQTDVGGIVGVNDAFTDANTGKVTQSVIDGCIAETDVTARAGGIDEAGHVGGLVGLNKGTVSNSSAHGNVTGGNTTGGFVGTNYGGSIYSSSASGYVSGAYTVGGFAGSSGLYSLIQNSYSTGDVKALGDNGANFGGFAGSVSGKLKNCISSGCISEGYSYNGGFAGYFKGTVWSYNDDLRSISGCYGNCITADGEKIKPLGNYIGGTHALSDKAASEIGVDRETADRKIDEMLRNGIAESKLKSEADKYKKSAVIPATVEEKSDITALVARLVANSSANDEIEVSYKSDEDMIKADDAGYILNEKPKTDTNETVTILLQCDGAEYEQPVTVTLCAETKDINKDALIKNITEKYAENSTDYWEIAALSAFGKTLVPKHTKDIFVSEAVHEIAATDTDTTLAMNIIALRSLGYDPTRITDENGEKINALEKLKNTVSTGNNGDAYRLIAYNECDEKSEDVLRRLLNSQIDNKGWSNNEDDGIDPDTTGAVLAALALYYNTDSAVKKAVDGAVEYLSSLMQPDGNIKSCYKESNYGTNANTSSMCAIGLSALGIDVKTDSRFKKNSMSLYDGIMNFASENENGFFYEYSDKSVNALATKQAVLAVAAADKCDNVFDFSSMPSQVINLQKKESQASSGGGGSSVQMQDVYLTLVGDTAHGEGKHIKYTEWIREAKIKVPKNASVREVIEKALKNSGYTVKGLDKGYVASVTLPEGTILSEYTNGAKSGWMYSVNGKSPTVGINDYKVKSGDRIKVYYSDDWEDNDTAIDCNLRNKMQMVILLPIGILLRK